MDARTVAEVEGWESRPFGGGYDGLQDLADREFTGCVVNGDTYLFMVRGRVVGVFDYAEPAAGEPSVEPADIERFEGAGGTAYEAPEPALALLYAMAATGGETRGRYYSKNTPLEEVDRTLRDGGFTGYLELSENVLSGDYYLVYHGGRRRSVAFVGQSRRIKGEDEAFDLASDEVGIYEVTAVTLSTVDLPGSSGGSDTTPVAGAGPDPTGGEGAGGRSVTGDDADANTSAPEGRGTDRSGGSTGTTGSGGGADSGRPEIDLDAAMNPRSAEEGPAGDPEGTGGKGTDEVGTDPTDAGDPSTSEGTTSGYDALDRDDPGGTDRGDDTGVEGSADHEASEEGAAGSSAGASGADDEGRSGVEPAVSAVPDDETVGPDDGPSAPSSSAPEPAAEATPEDVEAAAANADAELDEAASGTTSDGATGGESDVRVVPSVDPDRTARSAEAGRAEESGESVIDGETVARLRSELSARESRIEELRERLEAVAAERDELASERDELARRVSRLEERLAESGAAPLDSEEMTPAEVLSGTSILIRYRSKTAPTLAEAHDGEADREGLAENLLLEPHATFDAENVSVSGRTFDAFLEGTRAVGFLRWLVRELPFELRDTGNVGSMGALYDALPSLDRVEFDAAVTLDGGDRETTRFDLVGRDRRGEPLFVALLEDDRAPTDGATMGEFLRDATAAAESHESLVAGFAVTSSYFEPEALGTAEEATGGSLLSRSKRRSFVKTSRKGGYHLCLVEDREDSFYLSIPEL